MDHDHPLTEHEIVKQLRMTILLYLQWFLNALVCFVTKVRILAAGFGLWLGQWVRPGPCKEYFYEMVTIIGCCSNATLCNRQSSTLLGERNYGKKRLDCHSWVPTPKVCFCLTIAKLWYKPCLQNSAAGYPKCPNAAMRTKNCFFIRNHFAVVSEWQSASLGGYAHTQIEESEVELSRVLDRFPHCEVESGMRFGGPLWPEDRL